VARNGSSRAWRVLREQVIREEPLCQIQIPSVCTKVSTTADHIKTVRDYPELELVRSNVRGACEPCNLKRGVKDMADLPMQKALRFFN